MLQYLANSKHLKSLLTKEKIKGSWEEMQRFKEPINQDLHLEMQHSMKIKANLNLFNQLGCFLKIYKILNVFLNTIF